MLRAFLFLTVLCLVALSTFFVAENPGQVTMTWLGYTASMTMSAFAVFVLLGYVVVYLIYVAVMFPVRLIRLLSRDRRALKKADYNCIRLAVQTEGAVLAEDPAAAEVFAKKLESALTNKKDMAALFWAKIARLKKENADALYRKLLLDPLTAAIGYRWLIESCMDEDNLPRALEYAMKAKGSHIKAKWIDQILLNLQIRSQLWEDALITLDQALSDGHIDQDEAQRAKVAVSLQIADESEDLDAKEKWLAKAVKVAPASAAAALQAARFWVRQARNSRALEALADAYKVKADFQVYQAYAEALNEEDTLKRLEKLEEIFAYHPDDAVTYLARGDAYFNAKLWGQARLELAKHLDRATETNFVAVLMQQIENALNNKEAAELWAEKICMLPKENFNWAC
ncbi:MAG: hypothetical protein FWF01_03510, partial [Alphaproteobacteria bacterium]|nr:hypothetical protein [Alphaproteobacteria bacterium]